MYAELDLLDGNRDRRQDRVKEVEPARVSLSYEDLYAHFRSLDIQ